MSRAKRKPLTSLACLVLAAGMVVCLARPDRAQNHGEPVQATTSVYAHKQYRTADPPPQPGQPVEIAQSEGWPIRSGSFNWGDPYNSKIAINTTGYPVFVHACISGIQNVGAKGRLEFRLLIDDVEQDFSVLEFHNEVGGESQRVCLTALATLNAGVHTCKWQMRDSLEFRGGDELVVHQRESKNLVFKGGGLVWSDYGSTSSIRAFELCNPSDFRNLRDALDIALKQYGKASERVDVMRKEIEETLRKELEPKLRAEIKASLLKDQDFLYQLKRALGSAPNGSPDAPTSASPK